MAYAACLVPGCERPMSARVAARGLHAECEGLWHRIVNHPSTASPADTLASIRAEDEQRWKEAAHPPQKLRFDAPPGGRPVLGRDFFVGPGAEQSKMPGLCVCGCGLRGDQPHPGLRGAS